MLAIIPATMNNPPTNHDDLDLGQAQAYALDAESMDQLVDSYCSSLVQSLTEFESLADAFELEAWQRSLHALKGFIGLMAGADLQQLVGDAERMSRQGDGAQLQVAIQRLEPRLRGLLERLERHRGRYH
jgi:hypothetical protein